MMRIGWATPFNERSAIGRYSLFVCEELRRRGVSAEIIRTEIEDAAALPSLAADVPVHQPETAALTSVLERFDLIVLNVGDHFAFHGRAIEILVQVPAVTVVHDADLGGFFFGLLHREPRFRAILDRVDKIFDARISEETKRRDLFVVASMSGGVVAHSTHYFQPLLEACPGPGALLPLCYPDTGPLPPKSGTGDEIILSTFGMINENKQPDRILKAMANSSFRDRLKYRLIGSIEPDRALDLKRLAQDLRLLPPEIFGWVTDKRLFELLSETSVICCLRYPILEGGSASLVSALYTERPVIVADGGAYAEVPDDVVWKVSYGTSTDDLTCVIDEIVADPTAAGQRARGARVRALTIHSAEAYVDKLLPFMKQALACAPVIRSGRMIGSIMSDSGVSLGDPAASRIGKVIEQLFIPGSPRSVPVERETSPDNDKRSVAL